MSMISTATSGLIATQMALDTISQNIANANTAGYSRQQTQFSDNASLPALGGAGYIGQGVSVSSVTRSYNQFLSKQLNTSTSSSSAATAFSTMSTQVDKMLSSTTTGVPTALSSFFGLANQVADAPSSISIRQSLVSGADATAYAFNQTASQLNTFAAQANSEVKSTVTAVNTAATAIAALNVQISTATANGGQPNNNLLDQRDTLATQIAGYIGVSTVNQPDGTLALFVGSGQPLVVGSNSYTMSTVPSGSNGSNLSIMMSGQDVTSSISGGTITGNLNFISTVVDPALQQLGLSALGFAESVNNVQKAGFDLKGNPGTAMFNVGTPTVIPSSGSSGTITAAYDPANIGSLQASDYRLDYSAGSGTYTLTQLSDNTNIALPAGFPGAPASVGGMIITAAPPPSTNSSFLIRPTFNAAANIQLSTNFLSGNSAAPSLVAAAASATGGPGDNGNALNLVALQNKSVIDGANTIDVAYNQMVANVATSAQTGQLNTAAQQIVLNNAQQAQSSLAGVNLNEEASNLLLFQNAYQASAKVVTVAQSLFSTLLSAVAP